MRHLTINLKNSLWNQWIVKISFVVTILMVFFFIFNAHLFRNITDCRSITQEHQRCANNSAMKTGHKHNAAIWTRVFLEDRFFTFQVTIYCFFQSISHDSCIAIWQVTRSLSDIKSKHCHVSCLNSSLRRQHQQKKKEITRLFQFRNSLLLCKHLYIFIYTYL